MPASKAQQKAVNKYVKANYDLYQIKMPKGKKDTIKAHATAQGESVNGFINRAIDHEIERDSSGIVPGTAGNGPESTTGAGVVSLHSETLRTAQEAAQSAGETVSEFVERAVSVQAQRDKVVRGLKA